ncbi:hypothetical protein ABZP36_013150 [Zizania latifolia]
MLDEDFYHIGCYFVNLYVYLCVLVQNNFKLLLAENTYTTKVIAFQQAHLYLRFIFCATLKIQSLNQELLVDPSAPAEPKISSGETVHQLPQKWAHPITMPEAGCVLVATEVLDDDSIFERTVILLLRLGSRGTFDGPFGVILNRPLYTKIKHVNPSFQNQATPFGDSPLFFGGPVDMSMFLVRTNDSSRLKGFKEVIPGICFGFRTDLEKAAVLMKSGAIRSQDVRFFVGHAAWDYEQLLSEIRAGYWAVASCSTELISDALATDPSCLWTEILQLMGGHYSELSQKPKQDNP